MHAQFTSGLDVTQVVLYLFWAFFAGLIFWLRREDRREGYPLERDNPRRVLSHNPILIPSPKTFLLPNGETVQAPRPERDERAIMAERMLAASGSPLEPIGDPMSSNVGAASYAQRSSEVEHMLGGEDMIVPMRVADGFTVSAGPDPRGWNVVATDGVSAGTVKELWVDRADVMVRYLEVELGVAQAAADAADAADATATASTRLLPITMLRLDRTRRQVEVSAVRAGHFSEVPVLANPDRITVLEEERIAAFYAGGRRYADPKRSEPVV